MGWDKELPISGGAAWTRATDQEYEDAFRWLMFLIGLGLVARFVLENVAGWWQRGSRRGGGTGRRRRVKVWCACGAGRIRTGGPTERRGKQSLASKGKGGLRGP
jgi:hypothetical protein